MSTRTPERAAPQHVSIGGWIARGVVLVVFVPPRLAWEAVELLFRVIAATLGLISEYLAKPVAILFRDWVFRPLRNIVRDYLWQLLIQQLLFGVILTPLGAFLLAYFLRPIQRAIEEWLWRRVLKPGIPWIFRTVLTPLAEAVGWILETLVAPVVDRLIVRPLTKLWHWGWQWVLRPLLYALLAILVFGWRTATTVVRITVVTPCRHLHRAVLQPLFAILARAGRATAKPVRWAYQNVVMPWRSRIAEVWRLIAGA